jgi:hypothetical protein
MKDVDVETTDAKTMDVVETGYLEAETTAVVSG